MVVDFPTLTQNPPQAVAQAPQAAGSYEERYARARELSQSGQHDLAVAAFTALLALSPGNADVLLGRGLAHARMQRYEEAERDLRDAAAVSPDYVDVWASLGNVYVWSGRPSLAIPAYTQAITLSPKEPAHRIARAMAYRDAGERELARADLDAAASLGGDKERIERVSASLVPRALAPEVSAPANYNWSAGLTAGVTDIALRDQRWNEQTLSVRRHFANGSLAFESLRASRFGQHGTAWALDGYAGLWKGAYANLHYQQAPGERLFPRRSWRAELFQSIGDGWELSGSDDRMHFDGSRVDIYGVAVARYVGDFYVRLRHTNIVSEDSHGTGDRLVVRYFYAGDADNYIELAGSRGRSDDPLSLADGRSHSGGASASYTRFVTPRWGYKLGASYARESASGAERGVSAGLYLRW